MRAAFKVLWRPGSAVAVAAGHTRFRASADSEGGDAALKRTPASARLAVGGVRDEYSKPQREVVRLDPPVAGFFSKEIRVLGLPVRSHESVADGALLVAADRLSRMLRYLPLQVLERLQMRAAFHVIGIDQGCSDLPEHAHMRGVPGGYTGEAGVTLDQRARGMGGTLASCGEENLVDLDSDPRYCGRDILVHEFGHCVMDVGLPEAVRRDIARAHREAVAAGRWVRADGTLAYAGTCASEYWAELSMWYFGSHGEWVDHEAREPHPGPGGLAAYDPAGFALLSSVYGGTHPALAMPDPPAIALTPLDGPLDGAARASAAADAAGGSGGPGDLVALELENSGCDCSWELFWLDHTGAEHKYASLAPRSPHLQQTFEGHVWLLRASSAAPCRSRELRYAAVASRCVAQIAMDAGCTPAPLAPPSPAPQPSPHPRPRSAEPPTAQPIEPARAS